MLIWTRDLWNVMTAHSNMCECVYTIKCRGGGTGYDIIVTPKSFRPFVESWYVFFEDDAKKQCADAERRIAEVEPSMGKRGSFVLPMDMREWMAQCSEHANLAVRCDTLEADRDKWRRLYTGVIALSLSCEDSAKLEGELNAAQAELTQSRNAENNCRQQWHHALARLDVIRTIINREEPIS